MTIAQVEPDLTVKDVCAELRTRKSVVYDAIKNGDLKAYKVGPNGTRITRAALDAWKAALTVKAGN